MGTKPPGKNDALADQQAKSASREPANSAAACGQRDLTPGESRTPDDNEVEIIKASLDHLPVGIAIKDKNLRYLVINQTLCDMANIDRGDAIGKTLPEMNGKEATIAIRNFERENDLQNTPIVGVTAHALKGDMEACLDAGMDDYLSKPVSPADLIGKIELWLGTEPESQMAG